METKTRILLSVLAGEMSVAEAARKEKVSEQSIGSGRLSSSKQASPVLAAGKSGPSARKGAEACCVARAAPGRCDRDGEQISRAGHRKFWALVGRNGHLISPSTVLRIMADEGLLLRPVYQKQRTGAGQTTQGHVRRATHRAEPGLAVRLLRVRDDRWWDLAGRRGCGLLLDVRVRLALVTDCESAPRDLWDRTRPPGGRSDARRRQAHRSPDRSHHR